MGQRDRIPHVLRGDVRGTGQHLEIPVHGVRKRGRRFPHPLHRGTDRHRPPFVLPRNVSRTILESRQRQVLQIAVSVPQGFVLPRLTTHLP